MRRHLILTTVPVLAACALATLPPRAAEACSPPMPECFRDLPFLEEGATVPTNRRIRLTAHCFDVEISLETLTPTLRVAGEEEAVEGTWERDRDGLVWTGTMLPDATLEIVDTWEWHCEHPDFGWQDDVPACDAAGEGDLRVLRTFHTGPGPDLEPPPAPGAPELTCQEVMSDPDPCAHMDCMCCSCHPIRADFFVRTAVAPRPAGEVAANLVFWRRDGEAYDFDRPGGAGPTADQPLQSRVGDWHAVAVAVDRQGNMSAPSPEVSIRFPDACDFEQPFPGSGTAGRGDPLGGPAVGCGGAVAAAGSGASAWLLLAAALLAGAGRRRRRSPAGAWLPTGAGVRGASEQRSPRSGRAADGPPASGRLRR